MTKEHLPLFKLVSVMKKYPQVLVNVKGNDVSKEKYKNDSRINEVINSVEQELVDDGIILIRPPGTKNLIRKMIEDDKYITK